MDTGSWSGVCGLSISPPESCPPGQTGSTEAAGAGAQDPLWPGHRWGTCLGREGGLLKETSWEYSVYEHAWAPGQPPPAKAAAPPGYKQKSSLTSSRCLSFPDSHTGPLHGGWVMALFTVSWDSTPSLLLDLCPLHTPASAQPVLRAQHSENTSGWDRYKQKVKWKQKEI